MTFTSATPRRALRRLSARILGSASRPPVPWEERFDDVSIEERIARWMYAEWYSAPDPAPVEAPCSHPTGLVSILRAALPAATAWQKGWVAVQAIAGGACVAGRPGESRRVAAGDFANVSRPALPPMPGDALALTRRLEWVDPASGFWTAHSPKGAPKGGFVRLYWSVGAPNVGAVLRRVTMALDDLGARYMLKCPADVTRYERVDTLVVYLDRKRWPGARRALVRVAHGLRALLRAATPPLTQVLAPGLAFAEDPGRDQSFGQSVCRALASGALALAAARPPHADDGVLFLEDALRSADIDPERPWLSATTS